MGGRDLYGERFHFGVEALGFLVIAGRHDEGVNQKLHFSGLDGVRFGVQLGQPSGAGGRQIALALLDVDQVLLVRIMRFDPLYAPTAVAPT